MGPLFNRHSLVFFFKQKWRLIEDHAVRTHPVKNQWKKGERRQALNPFDMFQYRGPDLYMQRLDRACIIIIMEHSNKIHKSNIRYAKISLKKRMQLVKQVVENKHLISKVAKRLSIKLSTAKLIVKRYREEGSFFEAKADKLKRLQKQIENSGKNENITNIAPIVQNLPRQSEQIPLIDPYTLYMPPMVYFEQYCPTPYPYSLPLTQNLMFYTL